MSAADISQIGNNPGGQPQAGSFRVEPQEHLPPIHSVPRDLNLAENDQGLRNVNQNPIHEAGGPLVLQNDNAGANNNPIREAGNHVDVPENIPRNGRHRRRNNNNNAHVNHPPPLQIRAADLDDEFNDPQVQMITDILV